MKVTLVLYCARKAEFATLKIQKPPILQERMSIAFATLMLRVEKIVWVEDAKEILVCCGMFLKIQEGLHEGSRLLFPFGKIPEEFWKPEKYGKWLVQTADSQWDGILAPLLTIKDVDGQNEDFTGEE